MRISTNLLDPRARTAPKASIGAEYMTKQDVWEGEKGWRVLSILQPRADLGSPTSTSLEPLDKIGGDELFDAIAAGQTQPHGAAFTLGAEVDIEERTAQGFAHSTFRDQLVGLHVCGKFEFEAVGQFVRYHPQRSQLRAKLLEVAFPLLG